MNNRFYELLSGYRTSGFKISLENLCGFASLLLFKMGYGGVLAGLQFENNCEVGVFSKLTNAYCLVAIGGSENFYRFAFLSFWAFMLHVDLYCCKNSKTVRIHIAVPLRLSWQTTFLL